MDSSTTADSSTLVEDTLRPVRLSFGNQFSNSIVDLRKKLVAVTPDRWKQVSERVSATLLFLGVFWWAASLLRGRLYGITSSWFPVPALRADFAIGTDGPSRVWLHGENPYLVEALGFIYPPFVLPLFAWTSLFSPVTAYVIFLLGIGLFAAAGAYESWRSRNRCGDRTLPPLTCIAAILFSTPVLFCMERGNYDLTVLPFVIAAVYLLRRNSDLSDVLAGILLACTPWLKVYPGLVIVGLLALRRWRSTAAFGTTGLAIGLMHLPLVLQWIERNAFFSNRVMSMSRAAPHSGVNHWWHSLTEAWPHVWNNCPPPLSWLSMIPGSLACVLLLGPQLVWVSWVVYRSPQISNMIYPYFVWIIALASFVPPVANDYSLFFLPLAVIAVWRRNDPKFVQVAFLLLFLWWQPFGLPINGRLLMLFKLGGLAAAGYCLTRRVKEEQEAFESVPTKSEVAISLA